MHPLEPLTGDEIRTAAAAVRSHLGRDDVLFSTITLLEPEKAAVLAHDRGESSAPPPREARAVFIDGGDSVGEAVVGLEAGAVTALSHVPDARPALLFTEVLRAMAAVKADARWRDAVAKRGVTDLDLVQLDPWPPGAFDHPAERGARISRVIAYARTDTTDNGYARPIEGVVAIVDLATGTVVDVEDHGVVPMPDEHGNYDVERIGMPLRPDLKPLEISQPDGPSFTITGNLIEWQRWSLRVAMDPVEGLVLHRVTYTDPAGGPDGGPEERSILHRASITEMVVPYASTSPAHGWKNAFDAGEWGLGRMVNSLMLGCDCLGVIHYLDATMATEQGDAYEVPNAICVHEEDQGILWKHQDLHSGTTEVRRSRRLVVNAVHTVGNYEYAFSWCFYLDGSIRLEVRLTGIVQTQAVAPGEEPDHANLIAPGLAAPHHQHLFCARLDVDIDGPDNTVVEVDVEADSDGSDPLHNGFHPVETPLTREGRAKRNVDPARSRTWRIVNPGRTNRLGRPVGYKLLPGSTPTLYAKPGAAVARRAGFATQNLWVTPYDADQIHAAGRYPNQNPAEDGLPAWTRADRAIEDTDVVVWHTFGVTHLVRPEDWPVMPVEHCGFDLIPVGFFERNPALDVPPSHG
jgi:primary-amine oxidase